MDIYKFRKKLSRYIQGDSNETENALIEAWYKSYAVNEQPLDKQKEQLLYDSLRRNIRMGTTGPRVFKFPKLAAAASLLILSTVSFLVWNYISKKNPATTSYTVTTGTKGIKQIILPDSSVIWLNAASRIQVPVAYKGHFREVRLEEGEAFFEVKRNPQQPFIVHAGALNVQVLGTSFNIRNYIGLTNIRVAVKTGKVGVIKNGRTIAMLLPGQQLSYDRNNDTYSQQLINIGMINGWKDGNTYLTQVDFKELSLVIKNSFGLSLKTNDSRIEAYHFSLQMNSNASADQILKIISQLHNTRFRKEGNDIILY
jgi:transmembrane sensor